MKTIKYICGAMAMVIMASCESGDDNSVSLEVKSELSSLGKYIKIDAPTAKISLSEITEDGEPCIKLMSTLPITITKAVASNYGFDLEAEILDKDMNKISEFPTFDIQSQHDYDGDEYDEYLLAGNTRATVEITTTKGKWDNNAEERLTWERIRKDGVYIVLKPSWRDAKYMPYKEGGIKATSQNDEDSDGNAQANSSSGEDWDKVLDEYEKYCDELISLAKKTKAGDVSAVSEYASVAESAEDLQKKLDKAKSEMTANQITRLNKLSAKMAKAVLEMQ